MSDVAPVVTPVTTSAAASGAATTNPASATVPANTATPITREEYDALLTRINQQSGIIGSLKSKLETAGPAKPDEKAKRDEAWQKEIDVLKDSLSRKDAESQIRIEAGKVAWFDSEEAVGALLKTAKIVEGSPTFNEVSDVGGQKMEIEIPLSAAVASLAKQKQHWVKTTVQGGVGAQSGAIGVSATATYEELMRVGNAGKLLEFQEKYPGKFEQMQTAAIADAMQKQRK